MALKRLWHRLWGHEWFPLGFSHREGMFRFECRCGASLTSPLLKDALAIVNQRYHTRKG